MLVMHCRNRVRVGAWVRARVCGPRAHMCVCVCVCVCARARAGVSAHTAVRVRVRARVHSCVCGHT